MERSCQSALFLLLDGRHSSAERTARLPEKEVVTESTLKRKLVSSLLATVDKVQSRYFASQIRTRRFLRSDSDLH